ncbi:MAG: tRNA (adenosine(37)-N6)-threonylcarbamoyltransferase complex dimerization subunit type 1 TsaB [Candidatus Kuenenia sp.]|uniref:tRNA (adenosine(37)-N6)-threonylcarbamoyltransferase complex dimerization subunit type 1 TsaB n=1 Tax=Candidatus Kuenenia sp. TaxID=2499824 RepID=UPI0022BD5777|nr:tRNA (adenosine(37)-N6)-threonylcarbamoyltransferase complex dimerization subunit type 1 TsaB [Candidatus Kuenenia sp.]MCZ7623133.1 tRNA (adenosine(37)-N6)-threonylcarbamoyltransferase complex dimerization subunit type 1 TsaB [Candidatus Kuenenia sp.]
MFNVFFNRVMKVLGIETSGNIGGISLCENQQCIITKTFSGIVQHERELVPAIKDALEEAHWQINDIEVIAVNVGPGSYTGLRIGVTCAKTLGYALNRPVVDVPIFDIIAENYHSGGTLSLCPIIDARRKHVYACVYLFEGNRKKRLTEFLVIEPEKLLALLPRPVTIFGDGIPLYKEIFSQEDIIIEAEYYAIPKPEHVALLGEKLYVSGYQCALEKLLPLYLQR